MSQKDCYLGGPPFFSLAQALLIVQKAFGEMPYLVGSVLRTPHFRDVDVRMIMDDAKFEALFGTSHGSVMPFWQLINLAISEYLQKRTGLPVDFQVQKRSHVKAEDWERRREPLGMYVCNRDPAWMVSRDDDE
jgi:hypothetical protein